MTYKNVKWLLHSHVLQRAEHHGLCRLDTACQTLGIAFSVDEIPVDWLQEDQICVVAHGTKQFLQKLSKEYGRKLCPGSYMMSPKFSYSYFSNYYYQYMLNDNYILLPYGEIARRKDFLFANFGNTIFLRPDSTSKEFTGFSLRQSDFEAEINSLNQTLRPNPESICVVSTGKKIDSEFRFIIADGKVVTGSEYRWGEKLDIRADVLPDAYNLAITIAGSKWTPDNVFVADIGMVAGQPYLIEINPFSSSGLYACDAEKIIRAVGNAAWREFIGDD